MAIESTLSKTEVRCDHGRLGALITTQGVEVKLKDGCTVYIPWPKVKVELVRALNS